MLLKRCGILFYTTKHQLMNKPAIVHLNTKLTRNELNFRSFLFNNYFLNRYIYTSSTLCNKDYYKILGINKNASAKEIKIAYYELAKKYHPDTNKNDPNANKKFQEVSEAYQVLSDDNKRKQYDNFQKYGGSGDFSSASGPGASGFSGFHDFSSSFTDDIFRKAFEEMRNFASGGFSEEYGYSSPLQMELSLSFDEAAKGINKQVYIDVMDNCPKCNGSK